MDNRAAVAWFGGIALTSAVDVYLHRKYPEERFTLSWATRDFFKVQHPAGEAAFILAWGTLTAWYVPHIVKPARALRAAADAIDNL